MELAKALSKRLTFSKILTDLDLKKEPTVKSFFNEKLNSKSSLLTLRKSSNEFTQLFKFSE
jgi:hypothetical protein